MKKWLPRGEVSGSASYRHCPTQNIVSYLDMTHLPWWSRKAKTFSRIKQVISVWTVSNLFPAVTLMTLTTCTVGHKSYNPFIHIFLTKSRVMSFLAHCTILLAKRKKISPGARIFDIDNSSDYDARRADRICKTLKNCKIISMEYLGVNYRVISKSTEPYTIPQFWISLFAIMLIVWLVCWYTLEKTSWVHNNSEKELKRAKDNLRLQCPWTMLLNGFHRRRESS